MSATEYEMLSALDGALARTFSRYAASASGQAAAPLSKLTKSLASYRPQRSKQGFLSV
jgi:hypothetical protein